MVVQPGSPILERKDITKEHRLSNEYEKAKNADKSLKHTSSNNTDPKTLDI